MAKDTAKIRQRNKHSKDNTKYFKSLERKIKKGIVETESDDPLERQNSRILKMIQNQNP